MKKEIAVKNRDIGADVISNNLLYVFNFFRSNVKLINLLILIHIR